MFKIAGILKRAGVYLVLSVVVLLIIVPILLTIISSFKTRLDAMAVPPKWIFNPTLENFSIIVAEQKFGSYAINSLIVAPLSTIFSVVVGTPAAYTLARFRFRGRNDFSFWLLSTRMLPPIALIIPFYLLMGRLRLLDNYVGLILLYTTFNVPLVVWIMKGFFEKIPPDIEEAAMIDGCGRFVAFLRASLPISFPGLAATALYIFILNWNEFLFAAVLTQTTSAATVPVMVSLLVKFRVIWWEQIGAVSLLSIVPIVIFTILMRKHLVRGLTFGLVQGE